MANFDIAIKKTLVHEGGSKFTDDPIDRGGATKYGISQKAYPEENISNLTEERAKYLYKRDYWDRIKGDTLLSQVVAENIFDTSVNMGVRTSSRLAQLTAGIMPIDGIIGPMSVTALNSINVELFLANFTLAKIVRYTWIVKKNKSQQRFLLGWITRTLGA